MQEFVAEVARPVALSDRAVRDLARIRTARREHQQTHRVEPTTEDLSRATGLTRTQLERLQATERTPHAIDEHWGTESASTATLGDTIADPTAEVSYEQVLEIEHLRDLTDELDERERAVVRAHYGLGEQQQTLSEIGARLGLTAERARQIEGAALSKLGSRLAQPAPLASD